MTTPTDRKDSPKPRWEALQGRSLILPIADSLSANVPDESPSDQPSTQVDVIDYPRLRILLRDSGLSFRPVFCQKNAAELFGKSTRTIRNWIYTKQVPFHRWPSGDPYFSPQDLEDILTGSVDIQERSR
jgi:hypothetical protein